MFLCKLYLWQNIQPRVRSSREQAAERDRFDIIVMAGMNTVVLVCVQGKEKRVQLSGNTHQDILESVKREFNLGDNEIVCLKAWSDESQEFTDLSSDKDICNNCRLKVVLKSEVS